MKLDTNFIEKLAKVLNSNGLTEISLEEGEQAVTIRKEMIVGAAPQVSMPVTTVVSDTKEEVEEAESRTHAITSPMVGTFYAAISKESKPFVEVGSNVKEGDVVCVIEAMKLMNEIKTEYTGKITQICVKNGDPIEYGQVLMYVE